jgi:uncharacterized protein YjdB
MSVLVFRGRRSRGRVAALGLAAAFAAACAGSTEPHKDVAPAAATPNVTTTITGNAGAALNVPLTVTVTNAAGEPLDTVLVTFAVSGGGSLSNPSIRTGANGQASTNWTLGPVAGTQTVTATVGTLAPITFTANALAGPASKLTKLSADPQTAPAGTNVPVAPSVKVTDAFDNPIANVLVTFNVTAGGGSITGSAANSDANGVATVGSWTLGKGIGPNTLTASANGITGSVSFSASGTAGAVAKVEITNTAPSLTTGQTFTLTARALDANGNVVTGAPIGWTSSAPAVATVGAATGIVTAVSAGSATITATSGTIAATTTVAVVGSPSNNGSGTDTLGIGSSVANIAIANNIAYLARMTTGKLILVDIGAGALADSVTLGGSVVDVVANTTGSVVIAATSNPNKLYFLSGAGVRADSIDLPAAPVRMALAANGTKLFVDLDNFYVYVYDVASRSLLTQFIASGNVVAMKTAPGDTLVYAATRLGNVFEMSTATNAVKRRIDLSPNIMDLTFTSDGKTLLTADGSSTVTVTQLAPGGMSSDVLNFTQNVTAIAVTPDGKELWAGQPNALSIVRIINNHFDVIGPSIAGFGSLPTMIRFDRVGSTVVIYDSGANQLYISR